MPQIKGEKKILIHASVSEAVWTEIELLFYDPVRGRTRYGVKSRIIDTLLQRYLKEIKSGRANPSADLEQYGSG